MNAVINFSSGAWGRTFPSKVISKSIRDVFLHDRDFKKTKHHFTEMIATTMGSSHYDSS